MGSGREGEEAASASPVNLRIRVITISCAVDCVPYRVKQYWYSAVLTEGNGADTGAAASLTSEFHCFAPIWRMSLKPWHWWL